MIRVFLLGLGVCWLVGWLVRSTWQKHGNTVLGALTIGALGVFLWRHRRTAGPAALTAAGCVWAAGWLVAMRLRPDLRWSTAFAVTIAGLAWWAASDWARHGDRPWSEVVADWRDRKILAEAAAGALAPGGRLRGVGLGGDGTATIEVDGTADAPDPGQVAAAANAAGLTRPILHPRPASSSPVIGQHTLTLGTNPPPAEDEWGWARGGETWPG